MLSEMVHNQEHINESTLYSSKHVRKDQKQRGGGGNMVAVVNASPTNLASKFSHASVAYELDIT